MLKHHDSAIELDDDDLVLVDEPAPRVSLSALRPALEQSDEVVDECLATIGAEASRAQASWPSARATAAPAPAPSPRASGRFPTRSLGGSRLPAVTAPPFMRAPSPMRAAPIAELEEDEEDLAVTLSRPPPAFTRRSLPSVAPAPYAPSSSVAPVALPAQAGTEGTVIVIRERPKPAWIVGSALAGALVAAAVTLVAPRVLSPAPRAQAAAPPPAATVAAPPAARPPLPAAPVAAPPAPAAAPPAPAVVRFTDDDAVTIAALSEAEAGGARGESAKKSAPKAHRRAPHHARRRHKKKKKAAPVGPVLPDGTVALVAASEPEPKPRAAREGHAGAAERALAEAQLRASMK